MTSLLLFLRKMHYETPCGRTRARAAPPEANFTVPGKDGHGGRNESTRRFAGPSRVDANAHRPGGTGGGAGGGGQRGCSAGARRSRWIVLPHLSRMCPARGISPRIAVARSATALPLLAAFEAAAQSGCGHNNRRPLILQPLGMYRFSRCCRGFIHVVRTLSRCGYVLRNLEVLAELIVQCEGEGRALLSRSAPGKRIKDLSYHAPMSSFLNSVVMVM